MYKIDKSGKFIVINIFLIACLTLGAWGQEKITPLSEETEKANTATDNKLLEQANLLIKQINIQINDKGKDILVLAKGIKKFGKGGRSAWASNIIYFAREFKHYQVIKIVNDRGIEELKVVDGIQVKSYNDESAKGYFRETMKLSPGDIYVSSLLTSNITNKKVIQLATPLVDISNMDKGVLLFEWTPQSITDLITNFKIENNGHVIIVDGEGNYIYHPERKKILNDKITDTEGLKNVFQLMLTEESGVAEYQVGESRYEIGFAPYSQMGWFVGVVKPLNAAAPQQPKLPVTPDVGAESPAAVLDTTAQFDAAQPPEKSAAPKTDSLGTAVTEAEPPPREIKQLSPISQATRKVLDGSLRNQKINSLRVLTKLEVTSPDGVKYRLKIRQSANQVRKSSYQRLMEKNKNTLITYNDFDEQYYKQTRFEVISPSFLSESIVTRYNKATVIKPSERRVITMKAEELKDYQELVNDELVNIPRQFASLDFEKFGNDTFDIKIINDVPTYVITMLLKQNIVSKGLTFAKLRIMIHGDYFMPAKLEWFDPQGVNILTISYDDVQINGLFADNDFKINPPPKYRVQTFGELKPTLLKAARQREEEIGALFSEQEVRQLMRDALKKRGAVIARGIAAACVKFIKDGKIKDLQDAVGWAQKEENVNYVMIVDSAGETVVATKTRPTAGGLARNLEIVQPLKEANRALGLIRIGLSTEEVDMVLKDMKKSKSGKKAKKSITPVKRTPDTK